MKKTNKFLDSGTLKIIAIITMLIDHFSYVIYRIVPGYDLSLYNLMRNVGRISFPIIAFLIVEGFFHTHNVRKYIMRLLFFALLSEIPYDLAFHDTCFYLQKQNVFFTLALGLVAVYGVSTCMGFQTLNYVKQLGIILIATGMATTLQSDYGAHGVLLIVLLYYIHFYLEQWLPLLGAGAAIFLLDEPYAALAFLPVYLYNGKRGMKLKYIFYLIYPIHLLLFGMIRFLYISKAGMP